MCFLNYFATRNVDNRTMLITSCLLNKFILFSVGIITSSFLFLQNHCFSLFAALFVLSFALFVRGFCCIVGYHNAVCECTIFYWLVIRLC